MENSSGNSEDDHQRHPPSGRPTSRLSSLEYLGTVAAASEIIDLGAYANVIECSRLQAPEMNCHPYLLAGNRNNGNVSNLQSYTPFERKRSPNENEDQLSGNSHPTHESSCSLPYSDTIPFHHFIWNTNNNDAFNYVESMPGCSNIGKNNQQSTSRHSMSVNNGTSENSHEYSFVQTCDQSHQDSTAARFKESQKDSADSLRWPQQVEESLKNCDASSIKLLADACLISHERQSLKSAEEPLVGLIDMQEISSFDREPIYEDKQRSEGEDFSSYYDDCCEINSVICYRTVDNQDTVNNEKSSQVQDICLVDSESSNVILQHFFDSNDAFIRDTVWRRREIVKRLQRSKPTTKQFVKHLLRKVYFANLKAKKRKSNSIDKLSPANHTDSIKVKKNNVRSLPIILNLSKADQKPNDVLLNRRLEFMADREVRSRMKNKTESIEYAGSFAKRARNNAELQNGLGDGSTEIIEENVCLGKVQAHACHELNDVTHCLECVYPHRASSDYCRFMDFRKIHKNLQTNKLESHGFIDYLSYAKYSLVDKNKRLFNEFLPRRRSVKNDDKWSQRLACYVIHCLIDQYKRLLAREEKILDDCLRWKLTDKTNVPWRDAFNARELCDICSTTIFNLHLMCKHCALDVCIDCFYARLREEKRIELPGPNQDSFGWSFCTINRKNRAHKPRDLILSNLIPDPDGETLRTLRALNRILDEEISLYKIDSDKTNYLLPLPVNQDTLKETSSRNSRLPPFSYLFEKDVLMLESPKNPLNICLFQRHWYKGKPVIINRVLQDLEPMMWRPTILEEKCAGRSTEGTIVDCRTGAVIENFDVSLFWAGFLDCHRRIDGLDGRKLLLKLKDWPSGDKFSDLLHEHFQKFCKALPLPQYTHPNTGQFNLATNLPSFCIEPDLGPKLYIAYEMIFEPNKGTTNLHLDVSDAVNVLVNVTTPANINPSYLYSAVLKHLEEQNLDPADLERAKKCPSRIGALWTIFKPEDSETIRMYLHELAAEDRKSDCDDPIHDQMLYLDVPLRKRLETERGVKGYTFVQMLGDAVFIPAGAAHQVQNLLCCVKVAEDFVSPEGISYCATMAGEFRNLTKAHTNHEDKLQLPNIILHSLRKAASVLDEIGSQGSSTS